MLNNSFSLQINPEKLKQHHQDKMELIKAKGVTTTQEGESQV